MLGSLPLPSFPLPPSFARAANRVISGELLPPSHTVSFPLQEHGVHRIHHDALVSPLGVGTMPAAGPIGAVICPCVSISHSQQHEAMLVAFHDKTFLPRRGARWTRPCFEMPRERRSAAAAGRSSRSSRSSSSGSQQHVPQAGHSASQALAFFLHSILPPRPIHPIRPSIHVWTTHPNRAERA